MDNAAVTAQIMEAWDETDAEEQPTDEVVEEDRDQEETPEEPAEEEDAPDEEADEEEPEEEEEAEVAAAYESEDLEVRAFLAKYGGDLDAALKGAAEVSRLISKQGYEKNAAIERVQELEAELEQARAFTPVAGVLNEQQREWVETAIESGNTAGFVNEAIRAGEFDLARAVCQEWAREDPYSAMRAGQFIDQAEYEVASYVEPVDMGRLLEALKVEIPDLPNYSSQMTQVLTTLGDNHPLVQDARSEDLGTAARGIVGIYELARASSATVRSARAEVQEKQREKNAAAKAKAVVSSAAVSSPPSETPRPVVIGPGLTLEQLEAEFARQ